MDGKTEIFKLKELNLGKICFFLGILPLLFILGISIKELIQPLPVNNIRSIIKNTVIIVNSTMIINIIGIVLGIIDLRIKDHKKVITIIGLILNLIMPISIVIKLVIR
jgi:hypothetical protein